MIKRFGYDINYSPEPDTLAYLLNCGVKIEEVQVEMHERIAGTSYLDFKNSIWYMMKMFFSIFIFQWVRKREKGDKKLSDTLKGLLIIASILTVGWILRKIRKIKSNGGRYFWIFFAAILLLLAIFPEISYELCRIFGIMSPM